MESQRERSDRLFVELEDAAEMVLEDAVEAPAFMAANMRRVAALLTEVQQFLVDLRLN